MGVPHVICVEQSQKLNDKAAIEFTKLFYDEVYANEKNQLKSICDSYECAKDRVEKLYGSFEAGKLRILK